ncbi:MAG: DUF1553 domain-containing protein [Acidobacteria bacterium]|nr:DUF1553 domain-containing protein [Acidobacteriota bacterium]
MRHRYFLLIALLGALVCGLWEVARLGAEEAETADAESGDWLPHADCSFFGAHREDYLQSGLGAQMRLSEERSALTIAVVERLGPSTAPSPSRQRRRQPPSTTGPLQGDSIDDFVLGTLQRRGIAAAPPTTDAEFLRRASIDLTGRIPTADQTLAFLQDASADKRSRLVEQLLASPAWADRWAMFLGDLFRNTQATAQVNRFPGGRDALHLFFLESLRANKAYDRLVRELLAAEGLQDGRPWPNPTVARSPFSSYTEYTNFLRDEAAKATPASFILGGLTTGGPVHDSYDQMAVNAARDLLGVTHMDCVLCHDGAGHLDSLNVWGAAAKRSQGWGLAAFFQKVRLQRAPYLAPAPDGQDRGPRPPYYVVQELPQDLVIRNRRGDLIAGEYSLDTEGGNRPDRTPDAFGGKARVEPAYPFGGASPAPGEPYRAALGRILTADRQFARATVNYVWREFFGRGIVDPPDQFDLARLDPSAPPADPWTVQPSHPELLEFLAGGFQEYGFDLQWLMREIAASEAYQLSSRYDGSWSASYEPYLARHAVRRLSAEALFDAVTIATATPFNLPLPAQTQRSLGALPFAMQLPDVANLPTVPRNRPEGEASLSFLDSFFRGDREESLRSDETSILQALQLMNSPIVVDRVSQSAQRGLFAGWLSRPDDVLVNLLYLQILARPATAEETAAAVSALRQGDRRERVEDLAWALLNKVDFVFNY